MREGLDLPDDVKKRLEGFARALGAAKKHHEDSGASQASIDCPVCGKERALSYAVAPSNGHIWGACSTEGCVSWMQ